MSSGDDPPSRRPRPTSPARPPARRHLPGLALLALSTFLPNVRGCRGDVVPAREIARDPSSAILFGVHLGAFALLLGILGPLASRRWRAVSGLPAAPLTWVGLACAAATSVYLAGERLLSGELPPAIGPLLGMALAAALAVRARGRDAPSAADLRALSFACLALGVGAVILLVGVRWGGVVYLSGAVLLAAAAARGLAPSCGSRGGRAERPRSGS